MTDYCGCPTKDPIAYDGTDGALVCGTCLREPAPGGSADGTAHLGSGETVVVDERAVFLALRGSPLFKKDAPRGPEEDEEIVRKVMHRRRNRDSMKALLEEYGPMAVRLSGAKLHTAGVFTSEDLAAAMFPDLYGGEGDKAEDIPVYLPLLVESHLLGLVRSGLAHGLYVHMRRVMPEALQREGWVDGDGRVVGRMLSIVLDGRTGVDGGDTGFSGLVDGLAGMGAEEEGRRMDAGGVVRMLGEGRQLVDELGLGMEGEALRHLGEEGVPMVEGYIEKAQGFQARRAQEAERIQSEREKLEALEREQRKVLEVEERAWEKDAGMGMVGVMRKAEDAVLAGHFS